MKNVYIVGLMSLFFSAVTLCIDQKIKMYALYTPSHEVLKNDYFLPSLQDDFDIVFEFADQTCESAKFMDEGWTETTMKKVDLIIRAIQENWGSLFIFSDVDIQFFCSIQGTILQLIEDKDIMLQRNTPDGVLCTGFFVCRGNEKTLQLWTDVKELMKKDSLNSDQNSFNRCIRRHSKENPYGVKWGYLPNSFFGGGTLTGREWRPGMILPIPHDIMMHHANWTKGIKNKIAQLVYVRNEVMRRHKRLVSQAAC